LNFIVFLWGKGKENTQSEGGPRIIKRPGGGIGVRQWGYNLVDIRVGMSPRTKMKGGGLGLTTWKKPQG